MQNNLPTQLGRYRVLGLLGTGGMAEVFLAKLLGPSGFERPVVIKRILPHLAREQHFRDMFLDEARIVAGIQHQNVVHVQELCQQDGELFMVMEFLEGESAAGLARRLSAKRKLLSFGLAAHIVAEICSGLHSAHNLKDSEGNIQHLVHRDVSPANIFVTYDGGVKILDFGIAVAENRVSKTEAGQVKGKYAYMSPEQCKGKPLDRRSDVFSLGTVLYEISTCRRLFKRESDMMTLQAICSEAVVPPSKLVTNYPPSLEAVIMKAIARDRKDRYQSALEMRRDLLEVSRELNEGKIPEESLSRVMHKLFVDRIEQKHRMLSRIRSGSDVTSVPAAEVDSSIDLPAAAFTEELQSESAVSIQTSALRAPTRPASGRWQLKAGGAAIAIGLSVGGFVLMSAAPAPPTLPPPVAPKVVAPVVPALPEVVTLAIESKPAGARIYVNGRPRGETPITMELPRGEAKMDLKVTLEGHVDYEEQVVPDMNQRLRLSMVPLRVPIRPPSPDRRRRPATVRKAPVKVPKPAAPVEEDPYKRFN